MKNFRLFSLLFFQSKRKTISTRTRNYLHAVFTSYKYTLLHSGQAVSCTDARLDDRTWSSLRVKEAQLTLLNFCYFFLILYPLFSLLFLPVAMEILNYDGVIHRDILTWNFQDYIFLWNSVLQCDHHYHNLFKKNFIWYEKSITIFFESNFGLFAYINKRIHHDNEC